MHNLLFSLTVLIEFIPSIQKVEEEQEFKIIFDYINEFKSNLGYMRPFLKNIKQGSGEMAQLSAAEDLSLAPTLARWEFTL